MRHFIIVKYNDKVTDRAAFVEEVKRVFSPALDIPGVSALNVFPSCSTRKNRHDLMIELVLTPAALEIYDHSDFHHYWKDNYSQFIEDKTIFDCE